MIKIRLITGTQSVLNRLTLVTLVILCLDQVEELVHIKQHGVEVQKHSVIICAFITTRKQSLGQGNIFTSMSFFLSTGEGVGFLACITGHMTRGSSSRGSASGGSPQGVCSRRVCIQGVCIQGWSVSRGVCIQGVCL